MPGNTDYVALLSELGSPEFSALRDAQRSALDAYAQRYSNQRDVALELPTGAGKSLVALLISEVWRRDGKKVAILTGNKTLGRQMRNEASRLGIASELMEGSRFDIPSASRRRYHRQQAIGIMNYWVYFNQNPVVDPADLLILDDAHLTEHALHSLYSVEIDRFQHRELFQTIALELATRFPDYAVLQDALDDESPGSSPPELLSFFDQSAVASRLREIIDASPVLEHDVDLSFRWKRLRDRLHEVNFYVSPRSLWLRPYIYPLVRNEHYESIEQGIYMSATIGDTGDLARRLGTNPISKIELPTTQTQVTYGRRMVVMNKTDDADIPSRLGTAILSALSVHPKSVWLCSSKADANRFRDVVVQWLNDHQLIGHPTWLLSSLGNEIDEFKQSTKGHLFVAGRFDGMDFSAGECRLVIIATLPRAINLQEEFITAYLRDADFMRWRLNQRIIQALGRCNRSAEDFGVYVLADRRFVTHFGRDANRIGIPANIQLEIDYAEDWAERNEADLAAEVGRFLSGDFTSFDAALANNTATAPPNEIVTDTETDDEVQGWAELYESQNYSAAHDFFEDCTQRPELVGRQEMGAFYRWSQAKAAFLAGRQGDLAAQAASVELARSAIEWGGRSSWFNRLRSSVARHLNQETSQANTSDYPDVMLHNLDDYLERMGTTGTRFQRWADSLRSGLESRRHSDFVVALEELGRVLGYSAIRPRYQAATDTRWRGIFGNSREVITFEAKIEHPDDALISSADVGQAHNQLARAEAQYGGKGFIIRGTVVSHMTAMHQDAQQSLGALRIVRKDAVLALFDRVLSLMMEYRAAWSLQDVGARLQAGRLVAPKLPPAGWLARALETDALFIDATQLLFEWPNQR